MKLNIISAVVSKDAECQCESLHTYSNNYYWEARLNLLNFFWEEGMCLKCNEKKIPIK